MRLNEHRHWAQKRHRVNTIPFELHYQDSPTNQNTAQQLLRNALADQTLLTHHQGKALSSLTTAFGFSSHRLSLVVSPVGTVLGIKVSLQPACLILQQLYTMVYHPAFTMTTGLSVQILSRLGWEAAGGAKGFSQSLPEGIGPIIIIPFSLWHRHSGAFLEAEIPDSIPVA